ncbi:MAG: hypothetical protein ACR2LN_00290 [Candidatus Levyibacteriota bacterium]
MASEAGLLEPIKAGGTTNMAHPQNDIFAVKDVKGREKFPEVKRLSQELFRDNVKAAFGDVSLFLAVTAVHGAEPQQIARNVAFEMNNVLQKNGVDRKPIIVPYVPGHPIYGERNVRILREVCGAEAGQEVYLSEDLGRMLIKTEFGLAGYQTHLESVRHNQAQVQEELDNFLKNEFSAISLFDEIIDGRPQPKKQIFNQVDPTTGKRGRIVEINAGANVSGAAEDGRVVAHSVFPNTLHGLMGHVQNHKDKFNYDEALVSDVLKIGQELNKKFDVVVLTDIHPLGAKADKASFEKTHADAVLTPALKDRKNPPDVSFDKENKTLTITWQEDELNKETGQMEKVTKTESAPNYDPVKGVVYLNVSGSGIGAAEAKGFVLLAQEKGYVVSVPPWLKNQWVSESEKRVEGNKDDPAAQKEMEAMKNILSALPEILFAEDEKGESLVKAQMLRAGLGAVNNSLVGGKQAPDGTSEGIAIILLPGGQLDNPETRSNEAVIIENKLGVEYTGQPNIIEYATNLPKDAFHRFTRKVYNDYGIPPQFSGLEHTANVLVQSEIARSMKAGVKQTRLRAA